MKTLFLVLALAFIGCSENSFEPTGAGYGGRSTWNNGRYYFQDATNPLHLTTVKVTVLDSVNQFVATYGVDTFRVNGTIYFNAGAKHFDQKVRDENGELLYDFEAFTKDGHGTFECYDYRDFSKTWNIDY